MSLITTVLSYIYTIQVCTQHMNGTELTCNKSTQFTGHARPRHDLIGCSETRTVGARSVREL